jgi:hypothetical protein
LSHASLDVLKTTLVAPSFTAKSRYFVAAVLAETPLVASVPLLFASPMQSFPSGITTDVKFHQMLLGAVFADSQLGAEQKAVFALLAEGVLSVRIGAALLWD